MIDLGDLDDEDLRCAGLYRANRTLFPAMPSWFPDFISELSALTPAEHAELDVMLAERERAALRRRQQRGQRQRKPSVAKLIKAAEKAGVKSITLPDGTVLTFGGSSDPANAPLDNWLAKHHAN